MPYGIIKVDTVTFTDASSDKSVSISGLVKNPTFSGNVTATGTISGATIQGGTLVSGATVTGSVGQFTSLTAGTVTLVSGVFASGTAAAPSISVGTTTNGFYSPTTNQVGLAISGTQKVTVGTNFFLLEGVGETIRNFASTASCVFQRADGTQTSPVAVTGTQTLLGYIPFRAYDGSAYREVGSINAFNDTSISGTSSPGFLLFATTPAGSVTPLERIRITSSGNVGIGLSSPVTTLHSFANISGGAPTSSGTTDPNLIARFQGGSVGFDIGGLLNGIQWIQPRLISNYASNYGLSLCPNGGNVGVGTTAPGAPFSVYTASGITAEARIETNGVTAPALVSLRQTGAVQWNTSCTVTDGHYQIAVDGGQTGYLLVRSGFNIDSHRFSTGGSERIRIDSSGRLLVGTSTSVNTKYDGSAFAADFQLASTGAGAASFARYSANADGSSITLNKSRGSLNVQTSVIAEDTLGYIGFTGSDGTNPQTAASIRCQVDGTPGANDMPGRLVFSTTADGASTPTERMRITNAGGVGINRTPGPSIFLDVEGPIRSTNGAIDLRLQAGASGAAGVGTYSNDVLLLLQNGTERARIDTSGRLLLGTSSAVTSGLTQTPVLQVTTGDTNNSGVLLGAYSAGSGRSQLNFLRSKSSTVGTNSSIVNGDVLGDISWNGADGTNFVQAALIRGEVDGTPGTNDMPGRLVFSTTADGASSPTERMRIDNTGAVSIKTGDLTLYGYGGEGGQLSLNNPTNTVTNFTVDVLDDTNGRVFTVGNNVNLVIGQLSGTGGSILFHTAVTERARIDSSGRLLVGTSSSRTIQGLDRVFQIEGTSGATGTMSIVRNSADSASANIFLVKSRGTTTGSNTIVATDDQIGTLAFCGTDGTSNQPGAYLQAFVDGTPGTNDMPGRIVLATTLDGASSPTEQWRINNAGTVIYNQPAPAAVNTTATLTVANLTAKIITSTTAAAVTMTLPLGTDMDTGFSGLYTNMAFEWTVINTGATNAVTVQANTGHTIVGSATVAASNSGRFLSRRTAANTWVTYRLSS